MTPFDELVLHLTMSRVQAWERLNDPEFCGKLNMSDYYNLLIEAGYSHRVAQDAANKRGFARLQAGVKM